MSNDTSPASDRTLGTIIKELTADFSALVRGEIELLKLELRQSVAKLGAGGAMFAAAFFLALVGLAFLFVTAALGLVALGVPAWLSTLIVALLLFGVAAVLVVLGRRKLEGVQVVPAGSIEQIRADIDAIKADVTRVRSR